ncbi:MAG: type II toxin-antitoxin system HicB family antitoxin [Prevotellaceae bacterium]|jgi:predicted RNase H-like HicB family nuclease|nr:type II toxin-antitoxin system HicB family antitoxin [Prevotellaceae bacterium]
MVKKIKVLVEWCGKNFGAASEEVLGCVATGDSVEDIKDGYTSALELHFKGMKEDGDEVPENYELEFELTTQALLRSLDGRTTLKAIHRATGINENLLSHYYTGRKKARLQQHTRIINGIHEIAKELFSIV